MLCAQLTLCSGATVPRAASLSTRSPTTAATRLQRQGVVARGANTTGGPASGSGDVLALGGGTAWAYDGTDILRSTDLGASWQVVFPTWPQKPTALQVTGAFFLTSKDAWALTDHQWPAPPGVTTVWQTTDGGATWLKGLSMPDVERSDYGSPLQQFIFVDTKHGYALSDDLSLYATSYGGMNWHEVQNAHLPWDSGEVPRSYGLGCSAQDLFSLSVVSAKVLLITGAGCPTSTPEAWRSIDGGHSWASVALPAPRGGWAAAEAWAYPGPSHAFQAEVPAPEPQRGATVLSTRFFSNGAGVMALTTRPRRPRRLHLSGFRSHLAADLFPEHGFAVASSGFCRLVAVRLGAVGAVGAVLDNRQRGALGASALRPQPAADDRHQFCFGALWRGAQRRDGRRGLPDNRRGQVVAAAQLPRKWRHRRPRAFQYGRFCDCFARLGGRGRWRGGHH